MGISEKLRTLDGAIRKALTEGAFAESRSLLDRYFAELEQSFTGSAPDERTLADLCARTRLLVEWSAAMARSSRCRLASDLGRVRSLCRYRQHASGSPRIRTQA